MVGCVWWELGCPGAEVSVYGEVGWEVFEGCVGGWEGGFVFADVFAEEAFNSLPEHRRWDHAIELVADSKPANCKVYPLSPLEQKELDAFIAEGLSTGRIRPSKSPMASPVFFVKKKDGRLRLVQDYRGGLVRSYDSYSEALEYPTNRAKSGDKVPPCQIVQTELGPV